VQSGWQIFHFFDSFISVVSQNTKERIFKSSPYPRCFHFSIAHTGLKMFHLLKGQKIFQVSASYVSSVKSRTFRKKFHILPPSQMHAFESEAKLLCFNCKTNFKFLYCLSGRCTCTSIHRHGS